MTPKRVTYGGGDEDSAAGRKTRCGTLAIITRLRIEQIGALTPQAKGRVELANQTVQDRLIKEMRLRGLSSIEKAEAFLPRFAESVNAKFAFAPKDAQDAHRPLALEPAAIEQALARREERTLTKALTFSCGGVKYAISTDGPGLALRGAKVTLLHFLDGSTRLSQAWRRLHMRRAAELNRAGRKSVGNGELHLHCGPQLRSPLPTASQPSRRRGHSHVAEIGDILIVR